MGLKSAVYNQERVMMARVRYILSISTLVLIIITTVVRSVDYFNYQFKPRLKSNLYDGLNVFVRMLGCDFFLWLQCIVRVNPMRYQKIWSNSVIFWQGLPKIREKVRINNPSEFILILCFIETEWLISICFLFTWTLVNWFYDKNENCMSCGFVLFE